MTLYETSYHPQRRTLYGVQSLRLFCGVLAQTKLGSREPMRLKSAKERGYWLVPGPAVKDGGDSAPGLGQMVRLRERLLVRSLLRNHGNSLLLDCWFTWVQEVPAVEYLTSKY